MIRSLSFIVAAVLTLGLALNSNASTVTYTALASPANSPDANSSLGGSVDLLTLSTGGANSGGFFSSPNWGLFGNSGQQATATTASFSSLNGILKSLNQANESVSFTIDHGNIQNGGSIGAFVRDSSNNVVSTVFFNGGDSVYRVTDGSGSGSSLGVGFNSSAFTIGFKLNNTTGSYTLSINGNNFTRNLSGTNINSLSIFNNNAGGGSGADVLFNNVSITAVPEPSSILLIGSIVGGAGLQAWRRRRKSLAK